jgi:DNA-binding NarL/FixJ family response regulator
VSETIRLLIADDHPVVRDGLRGIFEASGEFEVAGEAANGREAVDRAAALRPDVVLMDLRMPELDGVSAIRALAARGIGARVLVLTTFDTDTDVLPAIEAGATGYLLKDSPPEELRRGVRAAARGEAVLSPSVATRLLGQVREPAREPLSQRELDILGLISHGCSNREAAARLFISEATVKTHVLHIYAKLGVNDRAAAVAAGFERGLLPRPLDPAASVPADGPGAAVITGRGLPGEDLADLTCGVVRIPVQRRLQVGSLRVRPVSGHPPANPPAEPPGASDPPGTVPVGPVPFCPGAGLAPDDQLSPSQGHRSLLHPRLCCACLPCYACPLARGGYHGPFGINDFFWCTGRTESRCPPGRGPG